MGAVPGAAIGICLRIGGRCKRPVRAPSLLGSRRAVDRRTQQWVAKGDPRAYLDQVVGLCGSRRLGRDAELGGRSPEQHWIADRLRRGYEQQPLRLRRQLLHPPAEARFDPARQRQLVRQGEAACEARRRQPAGQLEQGERVAACLRDDPIAHPFVQRPDVRRGEQLARVCVRQPLQPQFGQPRQLGELVARHAPRTGAGPTPPEGAARRTRAPPPRTDPATGHRPPGRGAAVLPPRRTAGSAPRGRRESDRAEALSSGRRPFPARHVAAAAAARGRRAAAHRADGEPQREAPSPIRRRPRAERGNPRRARPRSPGAPSCRCLPPRAAPAPRSGPRAPLSAVARASHAPSRGRAARREPLNAPSPRQDRARAFADRRPDQADD